MRQQGSITVGKFSIYTISAVYDFRVEVSYENKHAPPSADDIKVEDIELVVKTGPRIIRRIPSRDIQPWLWEMLNDPETLLLLSEHSREDTNEGNDA